jgi:hypothetical protein
MIGSQSLIQCMSTGYEYTSATVDASSHLGLGSDVLTHEEHDDAAGSPEEE